MYIIQKKCLLTYNKYNNCITLQQFRNTPLLKLRIVHYSVSRGIYLSSGHYLSY